MRFDRRKEEILTAVVEEYIQSAEPVSSKAVVERGVRASSATVRHEMSDLSAQGFLEQPHPSAGRLPTTQAFRYYVDHREDRFHLELELKERMNSLYQSEEMNLGELIAETARVMSELSRQVGLIMMAPLERVRLRNVHFQAVGSNRIRVVFHLLGGALEERIIPNPWALDPVTLLRLSNLVSQVAPGRTLTELHRELLRQREEAQLQVSLLLARAVEVSEKLVAEEQPEVIVRGQANLFELPEFAERDRLREVIQALEDKSFLVKLIEDAALVSGIRAVIGEEFNRQALKCCAMILGTYGRGEIPAGSLAVFGAARMDYARLIPLVRYTTGLISGLLRRGDEKLFGASLRQLERI